MNEIYLYPHYYFFKNDKIKELELNKQLYHNNDIDTKILFIPPNNALNSENLKNLTNNFQPRKAKIDNVSCYSIKSMSSGYIYDDEIDSYDLKYNYGIDCDNYENYWNIEEEQEDDIYYEDDYIDDENLFYGEYY